MNAAVVLGSSAASTSLPENDPVLSDGIGTSTKLRIKTIKQVFYNVCNDAFHRCNLAICFAVPCGNSMLLPCCAWSHAPNGSMRATPHVLACTWTSWAGSSDKVLLCLHSFEKKVSQFVRGIEKFHPRSLPSCCSCSCESSPWKYLTRWCLVQRPRFCSLLCFEFCEGSFWRVAAQHLTSSYCRAQRLCLSFENLHSWILRSCCSLSCERRPWE